MRRTSLPRLLGQCNSGVALVEFAITLPILLLMLVGAIELSRYAIIHQKLDKTANAMADFVTQGTSVSTGTLNTFAEAVPQIMTPFAFSGTVVFTSVIFSAAPTPPCTSSDASGVSCIAWQYSQLGGDVSRVGLPGGNAILPGSYEVLTGQNAIVAEIFYDYVPLLDATSTVITSLVPHQIYKAAVYKPRLASLATLN